MVRLKKLRSMKKNLVQVRRDKIVRNIIQNLPKAIVLTLAFQIKVAHLVESLKEKVNSQVMEL